MQQVPYERLSLQQAPSHNRNFGLWTENVAERLDINMKW